MKRDFSHLPAWVEALASGICRATANIIAMACSAVVMEFPKGVFITMMPFLDASGMSTLSTPIPARPMTLRLVAAASTFSVTFVADRMARPSYAPITDRSLSLSLPMEGSKVTSMPRVTEDLDSGFRELVGDENFWGHVRHSLLADRPPRGGPGHAYLEKDEGGSGRRGLFLDFHVKGPVEPWQHRLDIRGSRPSRRTRSADPGARRGSRRHRARHLRPPAAWPRPWRTPRHRRSGHR